MYWKLLFNCFNEGENRTISVVLPFVLQERLAECAGIHPRRPEGHAGVPGDTLGSRGSGSLGNAGGERVGWEEAGTREWERPGAQFVPPAPSPSRPCPPSP